MEENLVFYEFLHLGSPDYLKIETGTNFNFSLHLHQCYEIIFLYSGEMEVSVDNQVFTLTPGKALMIFPHQIHSLRSTQSQHLLCIFSPRLVQAYSNQHTGLIPQNNLFDTDDYLMQAVARLDNESPMAEKKGILYSLCGQFHRQTTYVPHSTDKENLLYRIFNFVEEEFAGECTLVNLAAKIGYDYSYLSRYFKKAVGLSFNTYVNHFRLSHACYLLENERIPILSCALDSGYTSMRSFNRNFKLFFGTTPAEYRKKKKKIDKSSE